MTVQIKVAALLTCLVLLIACSRPLAYDEKGSSEGLWRPQSISDKDSGHIILAMLVGNLSCETNLALVDAATQTANAAGVELRIYNANNDPQIQLSQIRKMVREPVSGMILLAQDPQLVEGEVARSMAAGIPVVALQSNLNDTAVTSFIGAPEELAGELAMTYVAQMLEGRGRIVILEGASGHSAHEGRRLGIQSVLDKNRGIRVLSAKNANWSSPAAMTLMERWLYTFDTIDAVIAENDDMALGARQVIEENGLDIPVVGIDGTTQGLEAVRAGHLAATVFQNGPEQAEMAVNILLAAIRGEPVDTVYWTECRLVSADNIQVHLPSLS